jgi:hypothetical protein
MPYEPRDAWGNQWNGNYPTPLWGGNASSPPFLSDSIDKTLKSPEWENILSKGHLPDAQAFLKTFTGKGFTAKDETGTATVGPTGAFQLQSANPQGLSLTLDPINKSIGVSKGNFELSGGWGVAPRTGAQVDGAASVPGNWVQIGYNSKGFNPNQTMNAPVNMQRFLNEKSTDNANTNQEQDNNAQNEIYNMRLPQARYW